MFRVIQGNLSAHSNTLRLTDITIGNNSIFEVYTNNKDVIPTSVSVSEHTVTIIFDGSSNTSTEVKVLINNIEGEYEPQINATSVSYSSSNVKEVLDGTLSDIDSLTTEIDERVPGDTVLGGVLYHSTSGNVWKKLNANNLDYDDDSTIYSAMGDIDTLETTSKNLVGAINELSNRPTSAGAIYEDSRVDETSRTWNVTAPNTYESSPLITTLPKGIYYMNIIMKSSLANPTDRAYIRVNTLNQPNTYTYFYTDAHVSTEDRNNVKIHMRGIIKCPNESNDIYIRYNISTYAALGVNYVSSVKIGGID